jgi:hypothetical protein
MHRQICSRWMVSTKVVEDPNQVALRPRKQANNPINHRDANGSYYKDMQQDPLSRHDS